ncbi:hypothetical protein K470DRAFT_259501 [Piedraia hortae CBS 480.64]|uniref:U6 snRNA phosphodiesterase n=1 Tax=Piedraia hortae CBS 480.64 TaxID=1314780 RepID=A0A6A7BUN9_9PEZI|nr:hypothetical protein K470DRAFT_259501 [Piedraia hortae CBS 480.64]
MGLVPYPDSDDDDRGAKPPQLPTALLDLYSSTVRNSTKDDPEMHNGRKRIVGHVPGNWPTHVYLEWMPSPEERHALTDLIPAKRVSECTRGSSYIYSLLVSDLNVSLPLHVSLSRPLVLRTEQKSAFLEQIENGIKLSVVNCFEATPTNLCWHPNEIGSRWFLVLQLRTSDQGELPKLLSVCNTVAERFGCPLLYQNGKQEQDNDKFHVSIAWSPNARGACTASDVTDVITRISFSEVKVRIGQEVSTIPLSRLSRVLRKK